MEKIAESLLKLLLLLDNKNLSVDLLTDKITVTRKIKGQKVTYSIRRKKE